MTFQELYNLRMCIKELTEIYYRDPSNNLLYVHLQNLKEIENNC